MKVVDTRSYLSLRKEALEGKVLKPAFAALRRDAEKLCQTPAPAVTDKKLTPNSPTQDPHDYVSIATYAWPNPQKRGGMPYVIRDGLVSPDLNQYDRPHWETAARGITVAVKAAYFLNEPRYAYEAARRLKRWFIDPVSRMNPHLCYAQMIPGRCSGRPLGIIDFALYLPPLLDFVDLLRAMDLPAWKTQDNIALAEWCASLLSWLESHPFGSEEEAADNNHGTYYDRLVACIALFLGDRELAAAQLDKSLKRARQQIEPDGSMPRELSRGRSLSYTLMNIRGFVDLACIGRCLGLELWSNPGEGGRTIASSVLFLYRYARSDTEWPWRQIEPFDWRMIWPVLKKTEYLSGEDYRFSEVAHRMPEDFNPRLFPIIEPLHPFGGLSSPEREACGH